MNDDREFIEKVVDDLDAWARSGYMTGSLEYQIERILKQETPSADLGGKTILNYAIEKLAALFRERERLRSGGTSNENEELTRELGRVYDYVELLESAMQVIHRIAQGEDSKTMNAITTIVETTIQEEE